MRFLLLRSPEWCSFDETYATLCALPQLARRLWFRRVPAAPTAATLVGRISVPSLERLVRTLAGPRWRPSQNLAGDGMGLTTRRFGRWMDARGRSGLRHVFVKLHALIATRAQFPFFVAARVTDARINDVPELLPLLDQLPPKRAIGNVALDKGYLSKRIAQGIANRGGWPVMDLKKNNGRISAGCYGAWSAMLRERRAHRRDFRCRYRRRPVIEGTFGAFKHRLGSRVRS